MEHAKVPVRCITIFLIIATILSCTFNNLGNLQGQFSIFGDSNSNKHKSVFQPTDNNNDDSIPRIAWLMSFPNSGTTYTQNLVQTVSGYNAASNYGEGVEKRIWEEISNGPFYSTSFPNNDDENWAVSPTGFVLTKTHCSSYCLWCTSNNYITTAAKFSKSCGRTSHHVHDFGYYDTALVKKAVILIRDPFSNIVARFHKHNKILKQKKETLYSLDEEGFRTMCRELDAKMKDDIWRRPFYLDVKDLAKVIPCSSDFFRWTQWHNLAQITTDDLELSTLVLHYEKYTDNFNETVDALHNFLWLDKKNEAPEFITGKTYREYFTKDERNAVKEMVEKLATKKTWDNVHHYFQHN